jgi:uncharacterized linocin/CFP29 family protein
MKNGNEKLPWTRETWDDIDKAVWDEMQRVAVAAKFLPLHGPLPEALTATSDAIGVDDENRWLIDEATVAPLFEIWSEFALTPQQVATEPELRSARTLAIRAANFVARAQDAAIFQGDAALAADPLFTGGDVSFRSGPAGKGLLGAVDADRTLSVESPEAGAPRFGERTFAAVAEGYARLQDLGHYGPYALILDDGPYGDAFAPAPGTLTLPADRIQPLVAAGFYGTGTLPEASGVLLSLGGDTMDLVVGRDATARFMFEDDAGKFRFRVLTRFALRLKDRSAVVRFDFRSKAAARKKKDKAGKAGIAAAA